MNPANNQKLDTILMVNQNGMWVDVKNPNIEYELTGDALQYCLSTYSGLFKSRRYMVDGDTGLISIHHDTITL